MPPTISRRRASSVSVMNIWPKSPSTTILIRDATRPASSLSKRSSNSSIGCSPLTCLMTEYCAIFKASRNDFCCPCEEHLRTGSPAMNSSRSSRWTPAVVYPMTLSF